MLFNDLNFCVEGLIKFNGTKNIIIYKFIVTH